MSRMDISTSPLHTNAMLSEKPMDTLSSPESSSSLLSSVSPFLGMITPLARPSGPISLSTSDSRWPSVVTIRTWASSRSCSSAPFRLERVSSEEMENRVLSIISFRTWAGHSFFPSWGMAAKAGKSWASSPTILNTDLPHWISTRSFSRRFNSMASPDNSRTIS